ncbi:DUF4019 domain-containing protein [Lysobacter auxotrophicus]|uniref:DUF4019 domain-containing protein n=1 Tax=Lysobacter auxotrophicus TaxID=2992573 RepID=A0ABM8DH76_9GAMM|nr:DUF4019 domain-containing protein [Lysobacter auxotrophicus]BDU17913.1 DUF4019 domain-containing protein [Lysobacter auxotrophicus]
MNARTPLAIALLFCAAATVSAQTRPATPQPKPQAAPATQSAASPAASIGAVAPNNVMQAALVVIELIDNGKVAQVWQGASPVARGASTEKQFVDEITGKRKALGAPVAREWTSISKQMVASGDSVPAGAYVSARFQTRFSNNQVAEELVSLHFDDDGNWRLAGYTIK